MAILGIGVDVVEVERIARLLERYGERFVQKVFTDVEANYCLKRANPAARLAARFAAKEAVSKALGTGFRGGVTWKSIWVENAASGQPQVKLSGRAKQRAAEIGVRSIVLSLTHTKDLAVAVVVMTNDE